MARSRQPQRPVHVANPSDGGFFYWLFKLYAFSLLAMAAGFVAGGISVYSHYARITPQAPDLVRWVMEAPSVSRMVADDGSLLGEFADQWREVVPYDQIPPKLIDAFLAAEDHEFFAHGGISVRGVLRAVWRDLIRGQSQGGSTITQQVAKQFLGSEKTLKRKVMEAILARRIEARYSKEEILSAYLNRIFLGANAYGVAAAARAYFSKRLDELDLGEMAMIGGLARAPSQDSPLGQHPENAKIRRDRVLDAMARFGYVTAEEAAAAKAAPISLHPREDRFLTTEPYFAEHVRRLVSAKVPLTTAGLRVETTVMPWVDGVAYENVDFSVRKEDYRQGYRGPEAHLDGAARGTFLERQLARYGQALAEGRRYLGLVEDVNKDGATVRVGGASYPLPLHGMSWATKWKLEDATNDHILKDATEALRPGDVIWVTLRPAKIRKFSDWVYDDHLNAFWMDPGSYESKKPELLLGQTPRVQGAIFTMDHKNGYVVAMVGGEDYSRSEYDRATQACRQPGSTYKPIYYSEALADGYAYETELNDTPRAEVDPETGAVYVPVNLHGEVDFKSTLEYALVFSLNVPSVDLFEKLGAKAVEAWARRLGFTTQIIPDMALALGASCVVMPELARAFAIFARDGRWIDPVYVRRILDRRGRVIEDHTTADDPQLAPADRLDRVAQTAGIVAPQAIPAEAAYLTSRLLREVVEKGYSGSLREIDIPAAGKTGTSSKTMDVWFVAYTSRWLTSLWLGDDLHERPLGKYDAAYMSAVPVWARYMAEASTGQPLREIPWEVPPGMNPHDRGAGTKGVLAKEPMPLEPHKKMLTTAPLPVGMETVNIPHSKMPATQPASSAAP